MSDGDSVATTVRDTETDADSDFDDDVVMVADISLNLETTLEFWKRTEPRFSSVYEATLRDDRISWDLSPSTVVDNVEKQLEHCTSVINAILAKGYVHGFKIGITYLVYERLIGSRIGYAHHGYKGLVVMSVHWDADVISLIERRLLDIFRRYDRRGQYLGNGHMLCKNRAPGGESASHGFAPHFCYVAVM